MAEQPWKTHDYFVSPWNYQPEVTQAFAPPPKVEVHEVTLRDGEQQAGVEFTADEKVRIAERLAEAGVQRIEAGLPAVSPSDTEAVKRIVKLGLPSKIFAFSRCMVDDVKRALDTGVEGIVMEIPSSEHIIEYAYKWEYKRALELTIESTRFAHENGLYVTFFPIDSTRADITTFLDMIEVIAREGHMDAIALVDTFGVLSPPAAAYMARKVRERIPDKPMEAHFHMDFSLGVANTVMAVANGVSVVQVSVTGIGERAGNTPLEDTVMTLKTMFGLDTGIDYTKLTGLSHLVRDLSGVAVPPQRGIVGDRLFQVESGIIATWVKNVGTERLTEAFPFRPEMVGQSAPEIVLGKGSGLDSVLIWLDKLGLGPATNDEMMAILEEVKATSLERKGLLDEDDFLRIAQGVLKRPAARV
ncbi:MAG TPA: pyruvate carboxyltransferase [Candidatus Dormibacteraeota bacterium]|nr:pyruvate carboxyltransferase [Candidatus Dormibacteraeota bacterium]